MMTIGMNVERRNMATVALAAVMLFASCKQKNTGLKETDTTTSGSISVSSDESFIPLIKAEAENFQAIYSTAKISVLPKSEPAAVADLMNKKVPMIFMARRLNSDELTHFRQDYLPKHFVVGMDAAAFLINKSNADSNLQYSALLSILSGKTSDWGQIANGAVKGKVELIFEDTHSSLFQYLQEVLDKEKISTEAFAEDSVEGVVSYVEQHADAIGVISASRITTLGDSVGENILSRVALLGIGSRDSASSKIFYRPTRSNLLGRRYPLLRPLYAILYEEYLGLGTGFVTYILSDEGQTIVERAGLVPAHMPQRTIRITNQF